MSASIPPAPTLSIAAGDTINFDGQNYVVDSVAAGSDNGNGVVSYAVTLVGGRVITVNANNTVRSSAGDPGASLPKTYVQSATI